MFGITKQDRKRVIRAKNHVLEALEELEKVEAENYDSEERIAGIIRMLGNAEDGLADELKNYEIEAGRAPGNALHWRVVANDEQGKPVIMGAFYTNSDAEEYAARLNADTLREWGAKVEEIA